MSAAHTWIARFGARSVPTDPSGDPPCVKLKIRLNLHRIVSFKSAYVGEVQEKEDQEAMEVDGNAQPADAQFVQSKYVHPLVRHTPTITHPPLP